MEVRLESGRVTIEDLTTTDPLVCELLERHASDEWPEVIERTLHVGARGMQSMTLDVGLAEIDARIQRTLDSAATRAGRDLERVLAELVDAARHQLDPAHKDSAASRTLHELERWRRDLLTHLDPGQSGSHPARLLELLDQAVGDDGDLVRRIRGLLDPEGADSASGAMIDRITTRIDEVRDLVIEERGRRREADVGTAKGTRFEDVVEARLREAVGPHDWLVERTSHDRGALGADARVGDFVIHIGDSRKIVVEAKKTRRLHLTGAGGILAELDAAMANRGAQLGICVSAEDAFPREAGMFSVYGDRILVVDDGDGVLLDVAIRWARLVLAMRAEPAGRPGLDMDAIADRVQRVRNLATRFSATKRSLTQISTSIDELRTSIDSIRLEVLDNLNDLEAHLFERPSNVVELIPAETR